MVNALVSELGTPALGGLGSPTNAFPTVSITSPTNGASFAAPANNTITITASDNGTVTNVALFIGTEILALFT